MTTSSSITTGTLPIGSSTPPICAAAERCTRFPTCAHEPTSACESIIVSSSTCAPTFTYAGGISTTPLPMYAPRRIDEPPGTMRMPSSACVARCFDFRQPALGEDLLHLLPVRVGDRRQRRADGVVLEDAHHLHGRLHRDRIRLDEVAGHQREDAVMDLACAVPVVA